MAGTLNTTLSDRKKGLISIKTILVGLMQEKDIPADIKEELNSYLAMYNNEIDSIEKEKEVIEFPKKKELKVEKLEYTIFLSRPSGIMVIKKEDTEEGTQKKYLEKKEKYDIFVYEETAYKKMIYGEKINMLIVNLDKNILNLLILFLKYKNNRIPYEKLYHKAWEGSIEHDKKARLSEDAIVMNRLKTAVATLRSKFKHIEGFRMPHARSGGYICEGNFKFCVILKNSTNQFYTLEGV